MITPKSSPFIKKLFAPYVAYRLRRAFKNVIQLNPVTILPGHSVLLLCNHFSWWDGFWAGHLTHNYFHRDFYIMMQEDHLQKRKFFRLVGGFSINRYSKEVITSLQYTAKLLDDPKNSVTIFPQGELISNHAEDVNIERGIDYIVKKIKGDCQVIYYSAFIDYFESLKPSVYFHMLDCGTNHDFDYEKVKALINAHHKQALKNQISVDH